MGRSVKLKGFFGGEDNMPAPAEITASISGAGMGEMLTLECKGAYRVSVAYRPIERLARDVWEQAARQEKAVMEAGVKLTGQKWSGSRREGGVSAYVRVNGSFAMLSLDCAEFGQISAPFGPIERMVLAERRTLA